MASSSSSSLSSSSFPDDTCHWRFSFDPTPSSSSASRSSSSSSRSSSSASSASLSFPRIPLKPPPGYPFVEEAFSNVSSSSSSSHHRASPATRSSSSSPVPHSSSLDEDLRREQLIAKRGWEVAISPAKNLFMNFLMIYMGGVSSSGIFGILILFYVLVSCFSSALNVEKVFAGVDADCRTLKAKADNSKTRGGTSPSSQSSSSLSSSSTTTGDAVYPSVSSSLSSSSSAQRGKKEENLLFSLSMMIRLQKLVYLLISLGGCLYVLNHCANAGLLPLNSGDFIGLIPEREFSIMAVGNDL
ncbi:transmembrane protein [Cystoisospora suis]|uniref:ER membrane protein complex subunit 4 n=1 Tax=Cystoisospora suis TaxID=483139 RepID=A0A2C6JX91_9APIC|nr:transmembrane protein [Cystoisospora suis]